MTPAPPGGRDALTIVARHGSAYRSLFQYHLPVQDGFRREKPRWVREVSMSQRQPGVGHEQHPGLPRVL
jgi:hypothetical protein